MAKSIRSVKYDDKVEKKRRTRLEIDRDKGSDVTAGTFLHVIKLGAGRGPACKIAGITEATLYKWLARARDETEGQPHYDFAAQLQMFEDSDLVDLLERIHVASRQDWRAAAWLLSRRFPNKFGDKINLQVTARKDLSHLSTEEVRAYRELQAKIESEG